MLVLNRQEGESIRIDDSITIKLLSIKGDRIRIGIDAPPEVSVHRKEIHNKIKSEDNTQQGSDK